MSSYLSTHNHISLTLRKIISKTLIQFLKDRVKVDNYSLTFQFVVLGVAASLVVVSMLCKRERLFMHDNKNASRDDFSNRIIVLLKQGKYWPENDRTTGS